MEDTSLLDCTVSTREPSTLWNASAVHGQGLTSEWLECNEILHNDRQVQAK